MGTNQRIDPPLTLAELQQLGYSADFKPAEITVAALRAAWEYIHDVRERGVEAELEEKNRVWKYPMPNHRELVGFPEGVAWEAEYAGNQ
jgi:hypothetical protein